MHQFVNYGSSTIMSALTDFLDNLTLIPAWTLSRSYLTVCQLNEACNILRSDLWEENVSQKLTEKCHYNHGLFESIWHENIADRKSCHIELPMNNKNVPICFEIEMFRQSIVLLGGSQEPSILFLPKMGKEDVFFSMRIIELIRAGHYETYYQIFENDLSLGMSKIMLPK
jgi:hypothetical protein